MKKLMIMLGAVAMSFGLFAADATPFATSFEAEIDDGASGTTFTPGEGWTAWDGASFTLGTDGADRTLPYVAETSMARRDSLFTGGTANNDYLKLETGSNELLRSIGGKTYLDQLVQFTGFEEVQTNLVDGTKIAVWMSGIETEGVETDEDYVAGETNLYVTCAKVALDGSVEQVALKIDGEYEVGKWYRLTIKSLGNIYTAAGSDSARAGFVVYIDGKQVKSSDAGAKALIPDEWKSEMDPTAKGLLAAGRLFTAIDTDNTNFATAGYKGIGAIDDIILDNDGPDFCQAVEVTIDPVTGAIIKKVLDGEGNEVTAKAEYVYDIAPGAFQIVWGNAENYMPFEKTIDHNTDDASFNDSDALKNDIKEVVVEVSYNLGQAEKYADEQTALVTVAIYTKANPDKQVDIAFVKAVTKTDYAFDAGTTIKITTNYEDVEDGDPLTSFWNIKNGNVTFKTGLENNKVVTLDAAHTLTFAGVMKAGSQIVADQMEAEEDAITLDPESVVYTKETELIDAFADVEGYEVNSITIEDEEDPLNGYTMYYLEPIVYAASVEIDGETVGYKEEELYDALAAVQEAVAAGKTAVVTALGEEGLFFNDDPDAPTRTMKIAQNDTITVSPAGWVFSGVLTYAGVIDGAVTATDIAKFADGEVDDATITLNANAVVAVGLESEITTDFFACGVDGYEVKVNATDTYKIFTVGAQAPETYNVTVDPAIVNGEVTVDKAEAAAGDTVEVTAKPTTGYELATITTNGFALAQDETTFVMPAEDVTVSATFTAIEYKITYMNGNDELKLAPASYTVEDETKALPTELGLTGVTFKGWYGNSDFTGDPVTEIAKGSTGDKTFYAKVEAIIDPVQGVIDDKVEGTDAEKAAAKANTAKLYELCGSDKEKTEAWIANVYGEGAKITAATLAAAPATSVALAVAFDVPVMVTPTISAPVVAEAAEGPAAFVFAIKDGATEVEIKKLTDNVKKIVKYAAALGGTNTFGPAKDTEVAIELNAGKIKAEFVAGPAAGFMKADFTPAE